MAGHLIAFTGKVSLAKLLLTRPQIMLSTAPCLRHLLHGNSA